MTVIPMKKMNRLIVICGVVLLGISSIKSVNSSPYIEDSDSENSGGSVDDFTRERSHHHSHSHTHHHHFHNHDGRREHQNHHHFHSHHNKQNQDQQEDNTSKHETAAIVDEQLQEQNQIEELSYERQNEQHPHQEDSPYYEGYSSSSRTKYNHNHGNCRLPESWKGKWFQSGIQNPILIDSKSIEGKGTCYESSGGDKFLFVEKGNCHRCVVINKRHHNVLQYKESSFCESKKTLDELCELIPGDSALYTMMRLDAEPIVCPFKGPYTFTYNRGYRGQCKNPVSHVDTCTEPTHLLLKYSSCPDVNTDFIEEELQCLAEWRDSTYNYLVGKLNYRLAVSNEERYRCFIYETVKGHTVVKIAVSGDASCNGLASPYEGEKTMTFTKVNEGAGSKCKFPNWVSSHHWHSLDRKLSVKTNHINSTMHILDNGGKDSASSTSFSSSSGGYHHTNQGGGGIYNSGNFENLLDSFGNPYSSPNPYSLFSGGTRITCQATKELSEDHVSVLAQHTEGCTSTTVCMHFYKRDSHVIELQIRKKGYDDYDCGKAEALGPNKPYVTLIRAEVNSQRCPYLGKYMATGVTSQDGRLMATGDLCTSVTSAGTSPIGTGTAGRITNIQQSQHGAFHSVIVGCGQRATMDFHSKCESQEPITYECHGSWDTGNGTGFLIASPLSRSSASPSRLCFTYTESDEGLQFFSSSESCRRDVSPNVEGLWAFNLTVDGQCAEPMTGAAANRSTHCDLRTSYFFAILVLVTFYASSSTVSTTSTLVSDLFYSLFAKILSSFKSTRRIQSLLLTSSHPVQAQSQYQHHSSRRMTKIL